MRAFVLFMLFWVLELWIYLSGSANPSECHWIRYLEGPASFLMGAGSFCLYHRRIRKSRPRLARLLVLAPVGLCLLLGAPLTPVPDSDWRIEIEKSTRLLTVYQAGSLCGRYPIALGGAPQGDKEFMGDLKTPLGELRVVDKGPSRFHKWLGLNYPTSQDALRGRVQGRITWVEFFCILIGNRNGRIPYGNSALGGAIGIHGGGGGKNWTLGCVALENRDIDEFYDLIPVGTEVRIYP